MKADPSILALLPPILSLFPLIAGIPVPPIDSVSYLPYPDTPSEDHLDTAYTLTPRSTLSKIDVANAGLLSRSAYQDKKRMSDQILDDIYSLTPSRSIASETDDADAGLLSRSIHQGTKRQSEDPARLFSPLSLSNPGGGASKRDMLDVPPIASEPDLITNINSIINEKLRILGLGV